MADEQGKSKKKKAKEKGAPEKKEGKGQKKEKKAPVGPHPEPRMFTKYKASIVDSLRDRLGARNLSEVPKLSKIVLNMGVGKATQDAKLLEEAVRDMQIIAGQRPVITKAKKAISNFKLRQGQSIGCMVTLRGYRMYEFFDRLVSIALPRVRDFRGLPRKSFDGHGNYSMGIREQIIFHEVDPDKVGRIRGMDITICTSAKTDEKALAFLEEMGMPFRRTTGA